MPHHRLPSDLQIATGANFPETFKGFVVPSHGAMLGWGNTVPADASTGWGKGAIFLHRDGSGGDDLVYQNNGSTTSSLFIEITSVAGADFGTGGLKTDLIEESTTAGIKVGGASDKVGLFNTTPASQPAHIADPASLGTMTTVGANTGTAGAGLSLIGDTTSVNQATNLMNDLVALQEDIAAIKTAVDAHETAIDAINAMSATLGLTAAS